MIYIFIAVILTAIMALVFYGNNKTDITRYNFKSDKIKNEKIIHLSDLHSKPSKIVLNHIKNEKPNIICITGDYINDKCKNKDKMLKYGKELLSIAPVVYITGNHERRLENFDNIMDQLKNIGFCVLLNDTVMIEKILFLGLDENQADFKDYKARKNGTFKYKDMRKYFDEIENDDTFKIVLSHYPENFKGIKEMNYSQYDFDIQLSGHAHGGQWNLPLIGPLFSPGQGIFPKYAKGSYGERPKLIVSRGIGNAEFPIRIFNHPEIVVININ